LNGTLDGDQNADKKDGKDKLENLKKENRSVNIRNKNIKKTMPNPPRRFLNLFSYRSNPVTLAIHRIAAHQGTPRARPKHDDAKLVT
jgi:hypothetical protein